MSGQIEINSIGFVSISSLTDNYKNIKDTTFLEKMEDKNMESTEIVINLIWALVVFAIGFIIWDLLRRIKKLEKTR